jgi:hypothetical protein
MSKLKIERIGGLAGFGSQNSHLRSIGEIDMDKLSEKDKKTVEDLFASQGKVKKKLAMDTFRYRISRMTSEGIESVEESEEKIPGAIKQTVKDEII